MAAAQGARAVRGHHAGLLVPVADDAQPGDFGRDEGVPGRALSSLELDAAK